MPVQTDSKEECVARAIEYYQKNKERYARSRNQYEGFGLVTAPNMRLWCIKGWIFELVP